MGSSCRGREWDLQKGKTVMESGSERPDPLPIPATAPISHTLPPRHGMAVLKAQAPGTASADLVKMGNLLIMFD
jgi:hypothetical protein